MKYYNIEHPNTTLTQNNIDRAKASYSVANNDMLMLMQMIGGAGLNYGISNFNLPMNNSNDDKTFSLGGIMGINKNAEVEGGETVQYPNGEISSLSGPSHGEGGIPIQLPSGATVFSDNIIVKGKSISDRKKARTRKETTLSKIFKLNDDNINAESLKRMKEANNKSDKDDLALQEIVKGAVEGGAGSRMVNNNGVEKYGLGGTSYGGQDFNMFLQNYFNDTDPPVLPPDIQQAGIPEYGAETKILSTASVIRKDNRQSIDFQKQSLIPINTALNKVLTKPNAKYYPNKTPSFSLPPDPHQNGIPPISGYDNTFPPFDEKVKDSKSFNLKNLGFSMGDLYGIGANIIGQRNQRRNTEQARATDNPNINYYEDFGKESLQILDKQKGMLGVFRDNQIQDLNISSRGSQNRLRNRARSVNTLNALDFVTQANINKGQRDISNSYTGNLMNILNKESEVNLRRDQAVAQGATQRDDLDKRDKDAYYTAKATNIADNILSNEHIAKSLNNIMSNKESRDLIAKLEASGMKANEIKEFLVAWAESHKVGDTNTKKTKK